jgi:hypothetical protein
LFLVTGTSNAQVDYLFGTDFENDATLQLAAIRAAADGAINVAVTGATVTYVKPWIGNDPAGFFVQGGPIGPAIFVRIDPATLAPAPTPGSVVEFTATTLATAQSRRELTALSGWTRIATGRPLAPLTQNISATADLVSNLSGYESELVTARGTLATALAAAGSGFQSSRFDTAAVSGNASLVLRAPGTLVDAADLVTTCQLDAVRVPLWRFNAQAQVSPFVAADLAGFDCPAPRVLSAFAIGPSAVRVQFDRRIDPASVAADASQFAFTGGLAGTSASVNGRWVDVMTSPQGVWTSYDLSVANTVRDLAGKGVAAAFSTATFASYAGAAMLVINEVNANIDANRDLVELRATSAGSVAGVELVQDPGAGGSGIVVASLPPVNVAAGDLIVIHFAPTTQIDETLSKTQCTDPACYAGAWDVRGAAAGLLYSNRVLALRAPVGGALLDGLAAGRTDLAMPTAVFPMNLQFLQSIGQWSPANCGGAPCTYTSTPTALDVSCDWTGLGTTIGGNSLRRGALDTNLRGDFSLGVSSFGLPNP